MEYQTETTGSIQLLILAALLIVYFLFLLNQQKTLEAINPLHRMINPNQVWLQLIPVFGMIWQFFTVSRIANSIRNQLSETNEDSILGFTDSSAVKYNGELPTYSIGIAYCVLIVCSIIPLIGGFASIAALICFIVYWVQLSQFRKKIQLHRQLTGL